MNESYCDTSYIGHTSTDLIEQYFEAMELDRDEPPTLVDTDVQYMPDAEVRAPDPVITEMEELNLTRVPLTIVTGMN